MLMEAQVSPSVKRVRRIFQSVVDPRRFFALPEVDDIFPKKPVLHFVPVVSRYSFDLTGPACRQVFPMQPFRNLTAFLPSWRVFLRPIAALCFLEIRQPEDLGNGGPEAGRFGTEDTNAGDEHGSSRELKHPLNGSSCLFDDLLREGNLVDLLFKRDENLLECGSFHVLADGT